MIDFSNFKINSKEELSKYISDEDIINYYIGTVEDNKWIKSPFRPTEKSPSFRISYYNNKWVWIDYGIDPRPKGPVNFVMEYFNINYYEALNRIYEDIYLNKNHNKIVIRPKVKSNYSFCKIRKELTDSELEYWDKVNVTKEELNHWKIYSGEIYHNGLLWYRSKDKDPLYIYMWDKLTPIYKGYRPYAPENKFKFYSHNIYNHVQGVEYIPEYGDILIITKSYKDVVIWSKLNYPAIAPHSENMFLNPFDVEDLRKRFNKIYINYDNDETGVTKSIKFTNEFGLKHFNLPLSCKCKDPFEFVSIYSYDELNTLFLNKLKRDNNEKIN